MRSSEGTTPVGSLDQDTIAAIATPAGRGGISIVRVSGPGAVEIAEQLTRRTFVPRRPCLAQFTNRQGDLIDEGLVFFFEGPFSFTGEDIVELHGHGGVIVTDSLLRACFDLGARLARPGEFSERAFLNNKLDLAQAEGLADLIDAPTQQAARQAAASLTGVFSTAVTMLANSLTELRVYVEAAIDFPEEEIDFLQEGHVATALNQLLDALQALLVSARQGALMSRGAKVVLTGKPNAGKSSLLNRLARDAIAIVTDIPGTTRDVIRQTIELRGIAITLSDTAGLRDAGDAIEKEGIDRAYTEMKTADLIVEVLDDNNPEVSDPLPTAVPLIRVYNKVDLSRRPPGVISHCQPLSVAVSATEGTGLEALEQLLIEQLGFGEGSATTSFSARERHVDALTEAADLLSQAIQRFSDTGAGELLAEDLRQVHDRLARITGKVSADDLLGKIFSSFCIGK